MAEVKRTKFIANDWRLEEEDLLQTCQIAILNAMPGIRKAEEPGAYIRVVCKGTLQRYAQKLRQDLIDFASSLEEDEERLRRLNE